MLRQFRCVWVVVCALGLSAVSSAQDSTVAKLSHVHIGGALSYPPYTFTHQVWYRDIVYDKSAKDTQYTSLDVYVADPVEPKSPVMVWVHGGGFIMGDKASSKDLASKPEYFTSKLGFILVSINYRLLPEGQYPTNVQGRGGRAGLGTKQHCQLRRRPSTDLPDGALRRGAVGRPGGHR